jgi:signal transduction histidine kinase/CheY-like chemotaxis protein
MSIRLRVSLAIVISALAIIIVSVGAGQFFVEEHLEETIEKDMAVVADIADNLVTTEIDLLKSDIYTIREYLLDHKENLEDLRMALRQQAESYANFMAMAIFDRNGLVDSHGNAFAPGFADSPCVQKAFAGETIISTSDINPNGELVFYICAPMENKRVLTAMIPGMFFSNIVARFRVWKTGNIFIVDETGTVLANIRKEWVQNRVNFIEKAKEDSQFAEIGENVKRMIEQKSGVVKFVIRGKERLCVYRPITDTKTGWSMGVIAPLEESPIQDMRDGLLIIGAVCLLMSLISSCFAAIILERPYNTINSLVKSLEAQGELLYTINNAAAILLRTEISNFECDLKQCMEMIARCVGVDRVRVWQNYTGDGKLYCSLKYEWSDEDDAKAKEKMHDIFYSEDIPGWEEKLSAGQNINGFVRNFSPAEQAHFSPQGIVCVLAIPVFFQKHFWGFVVFGGCQKEHVFSSNDEHSLRSGSFLMANAILRNEMRQEVILAREAAVASAEAKSDFLANMSHEMRTPLNAIIGLSELTLDSGEVKGAALENIEKVYSSGMTLLSLINDILDISKIESGKFELVPVEYDTPSLINDTATLNIVRIGSKPIVFHLDVDENIPNQLIGDELRIRQIFNNLLSNAFKYTQKGVVEWKIYCEQDNGGDSKDMWLVSRIKDSGIGIHAEDMEKLFSEYNQVDKKSNRKVEGTGLGLVICKNMAEMMGGFITVESEYGKGSTFTVRIRQGKVEGSEPIGPAVAENLGKFQHCQNKRARNSKLVRTRIPYARVLIVDDVATNLDVARGMMKPYGMQIDCVTSGQAAIDVIRNAKPRYNAIFMDHMMPDIDGIEATRIIRNEIGTEYAKTIPIIALTANAIVGNEDMFLRNGFQAFLSKPIDLMRMDFVINHWIRDKDLEKKLAEDVSEDQQNVLDLRSGEERRSDSERRSGFDRRDFVSSGKLKVTGLDTEQGLKRFGDDEEIYLEVLKSYTQNTPSLLDQLRKCSKENLPNYTIVVHGIKSSSRSIGADPIGAQAEALELAAKAGDFSFVSAKNDDFIKRVQTLLDSLSGVLENIVEENPKPRKEEPATETLAALLKACKSFDIDEVDKAMKELETYEYESGGDLVEWIRSQVNVMGFKKIAERLSQK